MDIPELRDFIFSRYNNIDSVLSMDFMDFVEMYIKGLNNARSERLWIAWVTWQPDLSFNEFLLKYGVSSGEPSEKQEHGFYIDQIGM